MDINNENEKTISKINGFNIRVPRYETDMDNIENGLTDIKKEIDKVKDDLLYKYADNEDLADVIDLINLIIDDYVSQKQLEYEKDTIYNTIYDTMYDRFEILNDRMNINDECNDKAFTYIKCALISLFIMVIIMLIMVCMIFFK